MYLKEKLNMIEIGRLCFEKGYTETCGSSITVRINDQHYLQSPSGVAKKMWKIPPEEIPVVNNRFEYIQGNTLLPADAIIHWDILEQFPEFNACLHVHGKYSLVYACAQLPIPSITETTFSLGDVPVLENVPWEKEFTVERKYPDTFVKRADIIRRSEVISKSVRNLLRQVDKRKGFAVLLPKHGIVICGHDLLHCYDLLERIEHNAFVNLTLRQANLY
ncbi:class II aldolase/adducin family protein [Brevibacillus sp. SAFN-007a]|uniref:class II aldolase/adducin family protein n=1 Tax=Brevibacillus sp. SAFN-007a TaxID=3436862 RepID=UPI003F7E5793